MNNDPPLVLILRALGIGDLLTALPALHGLKEAFPDHRRVLVLPTPLAPLAMLTGTIDAVFPAAPLALWTHDGGGPAVAVNLQSNSPASYRALLSTRPQRIIGFAHADVPETFGFPAVRPDEHEVQRWCRLLSENGIDADPSRLDLTVAPDFAATEDRGTTLLHPGASHPARRWPVERWAALARTIGPDNVIVTGSADEAGLILDVARRGGLPDSAVRAAGDILQLARRVAGARQIVSGDTGVAHLATALRKPSVVLFGDPHSLSRWGPPGNRPWHRVISIRQGARPHSGVSAISVQEVLDALGTLPDAMG